MKANKVGRPPVHLTNPIVKELLGDIKLAGGLHKLDLEKLCEEKPDVYGDKLNWDLLKAVQNLVSDFKLRPAYYKKQQIKHLGIIFDTYQATPTRKKPKTPATKPSLVESFASLTMAEHFGNVNYDYTIDVDEDNGWNHHGLFITKTPAVGVGVNPVVSTDVYSIMISGVDSRFYANDLGDFEPYAATQVGHRELVVEKPVASFDVLFGDDSFVFSDNEQEQNEYVVIKNKLHKKGKAHYTEKVCLRFQSNVTLDFQIIDANQRKGAIEMDFVGQEASLSVKWRIAAKPNEDDRILRESVTNNNTARTKFRRHLAAAGGGMWKSTKYYSYAY